MLEFEKNTGLNHGGIRGAVPEVRLERNKGYGGSKEHQEARHQDTPKAVDKNILLVKIREIFSCTYHMGVL